MQQKPTHERRAHAMQIATGVTAFAFIVWISTLGLRFAAPASNSNTTSDQVASVAQAQDGSNATLLVATTTDQYFH